jgi:hypothetical protein
MRLMTVRQQVEALSSPHQLYKLLLGQLFALRTVGPDALWRYAELGYQRHCVHRHTGCIDEGLRRVEVRSCATGDGCLACRTTAGARHGWTRRVSFNDCLFTPAWRKSQPGSWSTQHPCACRMVANVSCQHTGQRQVARIRWLACVNFEEHRMRPGRAADCALVVWFAVQQMRHHQRLTPTAALASTPPCALL